MKRLFVFITACLLLPLLVSCKENNATESEAASKAASSAQKSDEDYAKLPNIVLIEMEDGGKIKIELYPDIAPITVNNFKKLVSVHFYDGLTFHRISKDFVIQGGDPNGDGTGGPGYSIKGEFKANGFDNSLSHKRGVVSMARRADSYNSAGSQFFIMLKDYPSLDGQYAAFGKVIEGMDVVDRIARVETVGEKPVKKQVIKSVTFVEDNNAGESEAASETDASGTNG